MVEDFDLKYERVHGQLQENVELVREAFSIARTAPPLLKYTSIGSFQADGITMYVGIDPNPIHYHSFEGILAKMRLLYECSDGKVDLSRVYAKLKDLSVIVSEDVSHGGRCKFHDITAIPGLRRAGLYDLLNRVFLFNPGVEIEQQELRKTTFSIARDDGEVIRRPVIDLDRVVVRDEFNELFERYNAQYMGDERFLLHKV